MNNQYVFIIDGQALIIEKDENEQRLRFSMRVQFIISRFQIYEADMLRDFSHIYADKILLGLTYPHANEILLTEMIHMGDVSDSAIEDDYDEIANEVEQKSIEESTPTLLQFDDGSRLTPYGREGHFARESGGAMEDLVGDIDEEGGLGEITSILFKKPDVNSTNSGVVFEIDGGLEEGGDEIKVCEDDLCQEGSGAQLIIPRQKSDMDDPVAPHPEILKIKPRKSESSDSFDSGPGSIKFGDPEDEDYGFLAPNYINPNVKFTIPSITGEESQIEFNSILQCFGWQKASFMNRVTNGDVGRPQEFLDEEIVGNPGRMLRMVAQLEVPKAHKDAWELLREDSMIECMKARFSQNSTDLARLLRTKNHALIYDNEHDTYWGNVWGSGPQATQPGNLFGRLLMRVRSDLDSGDSNSTETMRNVPAFIQSCSDMLSELSVSPSSPVSPEILKKRANVKAAVQSEDDLMEIMTAYDEEYFNGELEELIQNGRIKAILSWTSTETNIEGPAELVGSSNEFRLTFSRPFISKLFTDGVEEHHINGVTVSDRLDVVQIFIEQLLVEIVIFLCDNIKDSDAPALARVLFGHSQFGEASFVNDEKPEKGKEESITGLTATTTTPAQIRQRLLDLHNQRPDDEPLPMVTLNDGRIMESVPSRSQTAARVRIPGNESIEQVSYESIVMINGQPV